jgi:hypothetical protein
MNLLICLPSVKMPIGGPVTQKNLKSDGELTMTQPVLHRQIRENVVDTISDWPSTISNFYTGFAKRRPFLDSQILAKHLHFFKRQVRQTSQRSNFTSTDVVKINMDDLLLDDSFSCSRRLCDELVINVLSTSREENVSH